MINLKRAGDLCKIDNLGRIVIPVRIRRKFDLKQNDTLEIYTDETSVVLKKYIPTCIFCGSEDNLTVFAEKSVCKECAEKIAKL